VSGGSIAISAIIEQRATNNFWSGKPLVEWTFYQLEGMFNDILLPIPQITFSGVQSW
jgi:hypothetical protein